MNQTITRNKKVNKNIIFYNYCFFFQILSVISVFQYDDLSNIKFNKNFYTFIFIFLSIIFYSTGTLTCYILYLKNSFLKVIRINSQIELSILRKRIGFLIILCFPIYLLISLTSEDFRGFINSGYISLISIPLLIVVTKFPLILIYTKKRINNFGLLIWITYYLTISLVSGSKISLIYILFILVITKDIKHYFYQFQFLSV